MYELSKEEKQFLIDHIDLVEGAADINDALVQLYLLAKDVNRKRHFDDDEIDMSNIFQFLASGTDLINKVTDATCKTIFDDCVHTNIYKLKNVRVINNSEMKESWLFFSNPGIEIIRLPNLKKVHDSALGMLNSRCKDLKELYIPNLTSFQEYFKLVMGDYNHFNPDLKIYANKVLVNHLYNKAENIGAKGLIAWYDKTLVEVE